MSDKDWLGMKVYVASSWRNEKYENVLKYLRVNGIDHYDFKKQDGAFNWDDIDPFWQQWTPTQMICGLCHEVSKKAFDNDFSALNECDALILLQPCGKSAHLEAGYFAGQGKPVVIITDDGDPELMFKIADKVVTNTKEALVFLQGFSK